MPSSSDVAKDLLRVLDQRPSMVARTEHQSLARQYLEAVSNESSEVSFRGVPSGPTDTEARAAVAIGHGLLAGDLLLPAWLAATRPGRLAQAAFDSGLDAEQLDTVVQLMILVSLSEELATIYMDRYRRAWRSFGPFSLSAAERAAWP